MVYDSCAVKAPEHTNTAVPAHRNISMIRKCKDFWTWIRLSIDIHLFASRSRPFNFIGQTCVLKRAKPRRFPKRSAFGSTRFQNDFSARIQQENCIISHITRRATYLGTELCSVLGEIIAREGKKMALSDSPCCRNSSDGRTVYFGVT